MTESATARSGPPRLSRHLLVSGLVLWGVSVTGACAPQAFQALLYPNRSEAPPFDLVAAQPIGGPLVWPLLVAWCLSFAFVVGHLAAAWDLHRVRHAWGSPALLVLSLASPLVLGLAVTFLAPVATHGAYHGQGVVPFLPAAALQLLISLGYTLLIGWRPHADPQLEGA